MDVYFHEEISMAYIKNFDSIWKDSAGVQIS